MIINEFSNGPSGTKEFVEFVVLGCPGGTQDIRGLILDDNSGRCGNCGTGKGIAQGHFRFSNSSVWANVPVGSIVVVYNANDKSSAMPPDDPNDANNDKVYIVPHTNSTYINIYTTAPSTANCNNFPMSGSGTLWDQIVGMRNDGDLMQIVDPNAPAQIVHAVGYGDLLLGTCANTIAFSGNGAGKTYQFRNLSNDNPFLAGNWVLATVNSTPPYGESPGVANSTANQNWINKLRTPAPEFVWQGTTENGNWNDCKNWDVVAVPCGTNPNVRIANTTAARNLNLATVPTVSLGNLNVDAAASVSLPCFTGCLNNTVTVNGTLTLTRGIVSTCNPITTSTAVYVANNAVGAVSGGSGNSFINGRLRRAIISNATNVNYNYPIGRGITSADYLRAEARFANTATLTELMGYYNTTADPPMTDMTGDHCGSPPTAYNNLITGFWRFESVPAVATPAYTMRVYPNTAYASGNTLLAKRPNGSSPWKAYGCCVPPYNSTYIDRGCLTGFSDFKPQTKDTPLPAAGLDFYAQIGRSGVDLIWHSAAEYGIERYEIEKHHYDKEFVGLGWVGAAGYSDEPQSYRFSDLNPAPGENRYRLRMVDFDGAVSFSETRSVFWGAYEPNDHPLVVYPNPARDRMLIRGAAGGEVEIFDALGRKIYARKSEGDEIEVSVADWPDGIYHLRANNGLKIQNAKITVVR
jgi:hypothetical protein